MHSLLLLSFHKDSARICEFKSACADLDARREPSASIVFSDRRLCFHRKAQTAICAVAFEANLKNKFDSYLRWRSDSVHVNSYNSCGVLTDALHNLLDSDSSLGSDLASSFTVLCFGCENLLEFCLDSQALLLGLFKRLCTWHGAWLLFVSQLGAASGGDSGFPPGWITVLQSRAAHCQATERMIFAQLLGTTAEQSAPLWVGHLKLELQMVQEAEDGILCLPGLLLHCEEEASVETSVIEVLSEKHVELVDFVESCHALLPHYLHPTPFYISLVDQHVTQPLFNLWRSKGIQALILSLRFGLAEAPVAAMRPPEEEMQLSSGTACWRQFFTEGGKDSSHFVELSGLVSSFKFVVFLDELLLDEFGSCRFAARQMRHPSEFNSALCLQDNKLLHMEQLDHDLDSAICAWPFLEAAAAQSDGAALKFRVSDKHFAEADVLTWAPSPQEMEAYDKMLADAVSKQIATCSNSSINLEKSQQHQQQTPSCVAAAAQLCDAASFLTCFKSDGSAAVAPVSPWRRTKGAPRIAPTRALPTAQDADSALLKWPEALNFHSHGVHYNRGIRSEVLEARLNALQQALVTKETSSSLTTRRQVATVDLTRLRSRTRSRVSEQLTATEPLSVKVHRTSARSLPKSMPCAPNRVEAPRSVLSEENMTNCAADFHIAKRQSSVQNATTNINSATTEVTSSSSGESRSQRHNKKLLSIVRHQLRLANLSLSTAQCAEVTRKLFEMAKTTIKMQRLKTSRDLTGEMNRIVVLQLPVVLKLEGL